MTNDKIEAMKKRINELSSGDPTPLEIVKLIGMTEMLSIATGKRYKITRDGLREAPESESDTMTDGDKLSKIREITERALRSSDPINLYKANCIDEIAQILGVELEAEPPVEESEDKDQITLDDILNDPLFKKTRETSIKRLGY